MASRATSTWRARPWHRCTWIDRSSPASDHPSVGRARRWSARRLDVGTDVGLDAFEERARRRQVECVVDLGGVGRGRQHELHLPGVGAPGPQAADWWGCHGSGRRRGGGASGAPAVAAMRSHSTRLGWSANRWTSRWVARARRTSRYEAGSRVRPNSETRSGRSTSTVPARRRAQASAMRSGGLGRPTWRRSARHSCGCHRASSGSSAPAPSGRRSWPGVGPGQDHVGPVDAVAVEQVGEVAGGGEAPGPAEVVGGGLVGRRGGAGVDRPAEVRRQQLEPGVVEVLVDDLEQRPDQPFGPPGVLGAVDVRLPRPARRRRDGRGTGTRRWRTPRRSVPAWCRPCRRCDGSATARRPGWGRPRSRRRTGRRAGWRGSSTSASTSASARSLRWTRNMRRRSSHDLPSHERADRFVGGCCADVGHDPRGSWPEQL